MIQANSVPKALEKLNQVIAKIDENILQAIHAYETLKAIDTLVPLLNNTYEANVTGTIQQALVHEIILGIKRIHDAPQRDRATMLSLVDALGQEDVSAHLITQANGWAMPQGPTITRMIKEVRADYPPFYVSADLKALKAYRDTNLAHLLLTPRSQLLFGQIEDALTFTVTAIHKLSIIYTGMDRNYESTHKNWQNVGRKFAAILSYGLERNKFLKAKRLEKLSQKDRI